MTAPSFLLQRFLRRTIARDLTLRLALVITMVVAAVGWFNLYATAEQAQGELETRTTEIAGKLAELLALPLWNLEDEFTWQIAQAYMEMDGVAALRVIDERGQVLYLRERSVPDEMVVTRTRLIRHEGHLVGRVELTMSTQGMATIRRATLIMTFGLVVVIVTTIFLLIHVLLQKFLNEPVGRLTDGIREIARGGYGERLPLFRWADMNEIRQEIHLMAEAIQTREAQLQQANEVLEERVEARTAALRESEIRYRTLVEHAPDAIVVMDVADGRFVDCNSRAEELFGLSREALLGTHPVQLSPPTQPGGRPSSEAAGEILRRAAAEEVCVFEWTHLHASGSRIPCEIRLVRLPSSEGVLVRGSITDITMRKQAEHALREAKEEAEASARARSQFLAMMSHEIRTPMNGVIGMASLLQGTALTGEQQEYVDVIRTSGKSLLTIINDILDFSKIEAGRIDLEHRAFDLAGCVREAADLFSQTTREKGIDLEWKLGDGVPGVVVSDPTRLRQILVNLIANAVKFTEAGGVYVTVDARRLPEERCTLHFAVRDTGIGIPPEKIAGLFQPFEQLDATMTRRFGGTGLGLSICKQLCTLFGGDIWAESEVGSGATFHFTADVGCGAPTSRASANASADASGDAAPTEVPVLAEAARAPDGLRVLLVEDNLVNRKVAVRMLSRLGLEVGVAVTGQEALDAALGGGYDVVLMDVHLPDVDGLTVAARLRERLAPEARPYVVALTADAFAEHREAFREAGMDDYLAKPLQLGALREALERGASKVEGRRSKCEG